MADHFVYIRGKSVECALGEEIEAVTAALRATEALPAEVPLSLIGLDYSRPYFLIAADQKASRKTEEFFYTVLYRTVEKAISDAGLSPEEVDRLPIFFGSTSIDIPIHEESYTSGSDVLSRTSAGYGNIASEVARRIGSRAAGYTFTTACTSSANGVLYASSMIREGLIERALVIGYDLFSNLGFCGFEALKLIAPPPYRPFDKNRQGIIMGEGCGAVILDKNRSTPEDFCCLGGANACDTHSVTTQIPKATPSPR